MLVSRQRHDESSIGFPSHASTDHVRLLTRPLAARHRSLRLHPRPTLGRPVDPQRLARLPRLLLDWLPPLLVLSEGARNGIPFGITRFFFSVAFEG